MKIKHVKMQNPSIKVDVKILKINWRVSRPTKEIGTKVIDHIITTLVSVINVTHIICEQCFYASLSVINVNNLNSALTLIQA